MKWEYKSVEFNTANFWKGIAFSVEQVDELTNRLGVEGWEMVSSVSLNEDTGYSKSFVLFFKRQAIV